jgi:hypothetical protein
MLMPLIAKARVLCENVIVVSNTDDDVFDVGENLLGKAVLTWDQNSVWIASTSIDGANWIWKSYLVEHPTQDETYIFKKNFDIIGVPASAILQVAADNSYQVWVNDIPIGEDATEFNYTSVDQYPITNLHTGSNNIRFEVKNWAWEGSTAESNPAGLLYRLEIVRSSCEPQCVPQFSTETNCTDGIDNDCDGAIDGQDSDCQVTIIATKIICDDEADLPNWGTGSGVDYPDTVIGPGTAIAYVGEHPNCHLVPGWSF